MTTPTNTRIHVVDALRGFAIASILLLHNIEHFDLYHLPDYLPEWLKTLDGVIWETMFFLFGGKSYAIFALLFGLTFFIQYNNQAQKGVDFRGRFAWRMLLLLGFGFINSLFYQGDILTFFAIIGLVLIPVAKLKDRVVFIIAILLLLQPTELYNLLQGLLNPALEVATPRSWAYFGKMGSYLENGSIIDTFIGNITNGKIAVVYWNLEAGRPLQTAGLFMLGMLAGRKRIFYATEENLRLWKKIAIVSISIAVPLFFVKSHIASWTDAAAIAQPAERLFTSWYNLSFTAILISLFYLIFSLAKGEKVLNLFIPLGKMSLTNYIVQSIVGTTIYYGFGLGLYKYTGATFSLLIGFALLTLQWLFCRWWLKSHKQGPLETIWHRLTWIKRQ